MPDTQEFFKREVLICKMQNVPLMEYKRSCVVIVRHFIVRLEPCSRLNPVLS